MGADGAAGRMGQPAFVARGSRAGGAAPSLPRALPSHAPPATRIAAGCV